MKTPVVLLLLLSLAAHTVLSCSVCKGSALRCHTCAASSEEDCNKQGSASCPQYADACATITGPHTVLKSCSYKDFCDKAQGSTSGAKMECCHGDNCNGPHRSHSHGDQNGNSTTAVTSSPALMLAILLPLRLAFSHF
ncbi:uncharacterized protein si:ch211-113d22.2 isoform X2 [Nerophis ophidion]|uniref:uncharacterized protein si:ch211-113d22.2 isoform X2 n=1 Tax=Nerophis ophidion TaxID=159077 RepID=UPI002AE0041E|nr:uncharacterized protein si:ch211-113d22.2 isoform X2 [Nerophis ophidion]